MKTPAIENDFACLNGEICLEADMGTPINEDHQILRPVVISNPINMVNLLRLFQISLEERFGNEPMLKYVSAAIASGMFLGLLKDVTISMMTNPAFPVVGLLPGIGLLSFSFGLFGLLQSEMSKAQFLAMLRRELLPEPRTIRSGIFASERSAYLCPGFFRMMATPHRMIFFVFQVPPHRSGLALARLRRKRTSADSGGADFLNGFWAAFHSLKHIIHLYLDSTVKPYWMQA